MASKYGDTKAHELVPCCSCVGYHLYMLYFWGFILVVSWWVCMN